MMMIVMKKESNNHRKYVMKWKRNGFLRRNDNDVSLNVMSW